MIDLLEGKNLFEGDRSAEGGEISLRVKDQFKGERSTLVERSG